MPKKTTVSQRVYGPHEFEDSEKPGRHYCKYGCGCYWSKSGKVGGPIGLHPIQSLCPNNPMNCERLPGDQDHRIVVEQRFNDLFSHVSDLSQTRRRHIGQLEVLTIMLLKKEVPIEKIKAKLAKAKPI